MSLQGADLRRVYESFANGNATAPAEIGGRGGRNGFVDVLRDSLGIDEDPMTGRIFLKKKTCLGQPRVPANAITLRRIAESVFGHDYVERELNPITRRERRNIVEVVESAGAVSPAQFPNVSAFNASISTLMQAKALENYVLPTFIGERLAPTVPTNLRADRFIGTSEFGDKVQDMQPGDPHPTLQTRERFVDTPATVKRGAKVEVTKEAVFFEQVGGQIMQRVGELGRALGLRREKKIITLFIGGRNSYKYNGTSYNTYLTSGDWINDHSNEMLDHTDLDNARQLAYKMTDQEHGERITVMLDTVVVMPAKVDTAAYIKNATEVERRTASATEVHHAPNLEGTRWDIVTSPILHQMATAAAALDGLALLSANADKYWWYISSTQPAFGYMENWAAETEEISASDGDLIDRGLVASVVIDEMGEAAVLEPRYVIRNKN